MVSKIAKFLIVSSVLISYCFITNAVFASETGSSEVSYSSELSKEELEIIMELDILDPTHDYQGGEIVSVSKVRMSESAIIGSENVVGPLGVIGNNYMTLYTTVTRMEKAGYDYFMLYAFFRWDKLPFFNSSDGIALAWSDNFTLVNSSMTLYYTGTQPGYYNSKAQLNGVVPEAGVGYVFHRGVQTSPPLKIVGNLSYGAIRAYVMKLNSSGTANVVVKYVHKTVSLGGGISFSYNKNGPSIGVSVSGSYDTKEAYTSWTY